MEKTLRWIIENVQDHDTAVEALETMLELWHAIPPVVIFSERDSEYCRKKNQYVHDAIVGKYKDAVYKEP